MHNHFITKCKICKVIISQCRCVSKDKTETWGVCDECKRKYTWFFKFLEGR